MKLIELLKSLPTWVLISISVFFVLLGDYFGKKWSIDQKNIWYLVACGASLLSGAFYFPVLLKDGLVTSSLIWTILSIAAFLLIGFGIFHESVTSLQVSGIVLGVVAVILLSI